ncbi:uncharacterized protein LOC119661746 [Hermetia illucens]|uniref:uncharacterized protein LOC119661746 n=1 Tax=Hermetia illucens TaxID=343691 RepID=UPI0018CC30B3|nr:uncharacterized protein LOC119661746 [Hermetia illucens]
MFKSNIQNFSIGSKNQERKLYNYTDIPHHINAELYPRKRKTELYFEPSPQLEYQSREAEHPKRALEIFKNALTNTAKSSGLANSTISPPTSSTTRMARDSYFS